VNLYILELKDDIITGSFHEYILLTLFVRVSRVAHAVTHEAEAQHRHDDEQRRNISHGVAAMASTVWQS
jgi:hypothetical protein